MYQIYADFRDSKLDAAANALRQISVAQSSSEKNEELNKAISFLELAYSDSKIALNKKRVIRERYFLFFESVTNEDVIPFSHKEEWTLKMIEISSTIYLLYKYKNSDIAKLWYEKTIDSYTKFAKDYYNNLNPGDLQRINYNYAYLKTATELERFEYNEVLTKYEEVESYSWVITSEGRKYIESQKKLCVDNLRNALDNINFEF